MHVGVHAQQCAWWCAALSRSADGLHRGMRNVHGCWWRSGPHTTVYCGSLLGTQGPHACQVGGRDRLQLGWHGSMLTFGGLVSCIEQLPHAATIPAHAHQEPNPLVCGMRCGVVLFAESGLLACHVEPFIVQRKHRFAQRYHRENRCCATVDRSIDRLCGCGVGLVLCSTAVASDSKEEEAPSAEDFDDGPVLVGATASSIPKECQADALRSSIATLLCVSKKCMPSSCQAIHTLVVCLLQQERFAE